MTSALDLFDVAWGRQKGYVSIAIRDPVLGKDDEGYWTDRSFEWPAHRTRIKALVDKARSSRRDVYWAPAVFDKPRRRRAAVKSLTTLWADLDEADPATIPKHLKPTAVWESSPGRWQALWKLTSALSPQAHEELNQRLTYALGADKGGWDLTQVLRIPGTHNHKYPENPEVKLKYLNGHVIDPAKIIDDLPEVLAPKARTEDADSLPNVQEVVHKYQTIFNARVRELLKARHAQVGTRSERLWELECLLAERGLVAPEIVSITRETVWNKFKGRHDEVHRLLTEAAKAIDHAGPTIQLQDDDVLEPVEQLQPQSWLDFDRERQPIRWLIADIWGEHEVGFISGLPKAYKSWIALDFGISIATGSRFLGAFQAEKQNVLLIQEEDPRPVLQDRLAKVAAAKGLLELSDAGDGQFWYKYDLPDNLHIISNQGFTLTDEWLESLEQWILHHEIEVVILDPLMMIAGGGFDEFKAFEFMEKVLKPLKRLRARTQAAIILVHHHLKGSTAGGARDMYGSVALWAWEEAAIHLQISGVGKVVAERFSKHALLPPLTIDIGDVGEYWAPTITFGADNQSLLDLLRTMESGATIDELVSVSGLSREAVSRQLKNLERKGGVTQAGEVRSGPGRPKTVWKAAD